MDVGEWEAGDWVRQTCQQYVRTGLNELSWAHSCLHLSQIGGLDDGHALEARVIPGRLDFCEVAIHIRVAN